MTAFNLLLEFWIAGMLAPFIHLGAVAIFGRDP